MGPGGFIQLFDFAGVFWQNALWMRGRLQMEENHPDIDRLLDAIEPSSGDSEFDQHVYQFATDCLSLIEDRMPAVGLSAIRVSNQFQSGYATVAALERAKADCWLAISGRDCEFDVPEVSAIRATICVLSWQLGWERNNFLDFASFFSW